MLSKYYALITSKWIIQSLFRALGAPGASLAKACRDVPAFCLCRYVNFINTLSVKHILQPAIQLLLRLTEWKVELKGSTHHGPSVSGTTWNSGTYRVASRLQRKPLKPGKETESGKSYMSTSHMLLWLESTRAVITPVSCATWLTECFKFRWGESLPER